MIDIREDDELTDYARVKMQKVMDSYNTSIDEHISECTYSEHDVCICEDITRNQAPRALTKAEIEMQANGGLTDLEKARYAKLREEQGKRPKIVPGQQSKEAKNQLLLGHLVEASLSMINLLETSEGSKMFFDIDVPLSDGRKFTMSLKGE